jgi:hypothetical protein
LKHPKTLKRKIKTKIRRIKKANNLKPFGEGVNISFTKTHFS